MSKVVLGLFLHLIGSYGIVMSSTRIFKNLFKGNVALFVSKEMYFSRFTFLKSLFISKKKKKVLHLSQETQIGRSVFKALTSN